MQNYKMNTITNIPTYLDGKFRIFEIKQTKDVNHTEYLHDTEKDIWFEELSITDKLKFEAEERQKKIAYNLRIPQMKEINSLNVAKIRDKYYKIFNAYHFVNKDGFKQTDLTLEEYPRAKMEEDVCQKKS